MKKKVIITVVVVVVLAAAAAGAFWFLSNNALQPSNENVAGNVNNAETNTSNNASVSPSSNANASNQATNNVNTENTSTTPGVSETTQNIEEKKSAPSAAKVQSEEHVPLARDCSTAFLSNILDPSNYDGVDVSGAQNYPYNQERNMILMKMNGASFVNQNGFVFRNVEQITTNLTRDGEIRYRIVTIYEVPGYPESAREFTYSAVLSDTGLVYISGIS